MEHMHEQGLVQTNLDSRFLIRATDVGAYSEIADVQAHRDLLREEAKHAKKEAAKESPVKRPRSQSKAATQPVQPSTPSAPLSRRFHENAPFQFWRQQLIRPISTSEAFSFSCFEAKNRNSRNP
ncbi:MAG: hypothetical protein JO370_05015 [Paucibacter sp.]|nr:hypothetical protein [Roseateles sp.]